MQGASHQIWHVMIGLGQTIFLFGLIDVMQALHRTEASRVWMTMHEIPGFGELIKFNIEEDVARRLDIVILIQMFAGVD